MIGRTCAALLTLLTAGCAQTASTPTTSAPSPPASETAPGSPPPTTTAGAAAAKAPSSADRLERGRPDARREFCSDGAIYRVCYAVPDEAACNAAFDQAWPDCTRGVVLHDGPSEEDREQGRKTGRCITQAFRDKFGLTMTPACAKAMEVLRGVR